MLQQAHFVHEVVGQRGDAVALRDLCKAERIKLPARQSSGQHVLNLHKGGLARWTHAGLEACVNKVPESTHAHPEPTVSRPQNTETVDTQQRDMAATNMHVPDLTADHKQ